MMLLLMTQSKNWFCNRWTESACKYVDVIIFVTLVKKFVQKILTYSYADWEWGKRSSNTRKLKLKFWDGETEKEDNFSKLGWLLGVTSHSLSYWYICLSCYCLTARASVSKYRTQKSIWRPLLHQVKLYKRTNDVLL